VRQRGALLALLCLPLTFGACATPLHERHWIEVQTANLELWSAIPESRSVELAGDLEVLRSVVEVLTGAEIAELAVPLRVFLVPDAPAYRTVGPRHTSGFFVPTMRSGNIVALTRPGYMSSALRTLQHEYVHWLIENRDAYPYPIWYNEGFAEFLSTVVREGDTVRIGRAPVERMRVFDAGGWLDFERLLSATSYRGWSLADFRALYAQSWALVHYLHFGQPEGRSISQQMTRYLRLYRRGASTAEAVEQGFGVTIATLEQELRDYVEAAHFTYVDAEVKKFSFDLETRVRPVPPEEIATQFGWLFLARGESDRGLDFFRDALASNPDHARAHAGLGTVESEQQRWEASETQLLQAVALAPDDPLNELDLAEHYHERARHSSDPEVRRRFAERAREHYRRSIELDASLPEAQAMLGATWSLSGEDPQHRGYGLENLERAHRQLPGNAQIKYLLARRYADLRRLEPARRMAIDALACSHGASATAKLEDLIEEIDASTSP
jgi:tetratricopeptide (TPR) repeat protein